MIIGCKQHQIGQRIHIVDFKITNSSHKRIKSLLLLVRIVVIIKIFVVSCRQQQKKIINILISN